MENVPKSVQPEMREYRKHHHTIAFDDYIKSDSLMMKYIKNDTSFSKTIKYLYNFLPEMQERVKNDLEEFDDLF